jgi:T5orf172 domain
MSIYLFKSETCYKVGVTQNINQRLNSLNSSVMKNTPNRFCLQHSFDTLYFEYAIESLIHFALKNYKIVSEYFVCNTQVEEIFKTCGWALSTDTSLSMHFDDLQQDASILENWSLKSEIEVLDTLLWEWQGVENAMEGFKISSVYARNLRTLCDDYLNSKLLKTS